MFSSVATDFGSWTNILSEIYSNISISTTELAASFILYASLVSGTVEINMNLSI